MNVSNVSNELTARTNNECALQRAVYLSKLNIKSVLELCVGPSLFNLEQAYQSVGIKVTGNDIDDRWRKYYSKGNWIIGDALTLNYSGYEAVVFAPPLSKGCSGKRDDSLSILDVQPKYLDFISRLDTFVGVIVLVLPGRSLATSKDRNQFYNFTSRMKHEFQLVPLKSGRRQIVKYYDLIFDQRP